MQRLRRFRAHVALSAFAVLAACTRSSNLPPPQGILFIVVDCLRADHVGAYGSRFPTSPRLDEMAAEGTLFEHASAQASWTRPSLPSLLTGLYPSEHGLNDAFTGGGEELSVRALSEEAETLAEGLEAKGYRTGLFADQVQLSRNFRVAQGFQEFHNKLGRAASIRRRFERWASQEPGHPFFAYLHFLDLHWPYCVRATLGTFDATPDSRNFCGDWRELGDRIATGEERLSPRDLVALKARYAEQMLAVDYEVGKLFENLRVAHQWDETLIVVTADHGEELFDHGSFRHGHTLYEELLHVPFVWKLPKSWHRPGGVRIAGLVETRSMTPTIFAATGVKVSQRVTAPSLLPWLLGKETARAPAEFAVAESNGMFSLRDARFKLIVDTTKKTRQLFDLERDPGETNDLANADPRRLQELEQRLRAWRGGLRPLPMDAGAEVDQRQVEELRALGYIQ